MKLTRWLLPLALVPALALAAACGDDDDDDAPTSTATSTAASSASASATEAADTSFPLTVEHKYGSTEIPEKPVRVVSVGYSEQDTLLALGVTPVGLRYWYGDYDYATWPWAQDELGDAKPEIIAEAEIDYEAIALLEPDVIVGVTSGMTEEEYGLLSEIAPTIPQPGEYVDYGVPWRVAVQIIGDVVGESELATQIIDDIDARFEEIKEEHPDFVGATAAVAFMFNALPGGYASSDGRSQLLTDMGFVIPEEFDEVAGDAFYFSISAEQIALLDVDALVWITGYGPGLEEILALPTRSSLKAVGEGREVFIDELLGGAFSFGSPLSIDFLLENLVPMLAAAVDGDPATEVEDTVENP